MQGLSKTAWSLLSGIQCVQAYLWMSSVSRAARGALKLYCITARVNKLYLFQHQVYLPVQLILYNIAHNSARWLSHYSLLRRQLKVAAAYTVQRSMSKHEDAVQLVLSILLSNSITITCTIQSLEQCWVAWSLVLVLDKNGHYLHSLSGAVQIITTTATVWTNSSLLQAPHHKSMTCALVDIPIPFRQWKQLILWKVLL